MNAPSRPTVTLAALGRIVETCPTLSPAHRRDVVSALGSIAAALGSKHEEVAFEPADLRARLARVTRRDTPLAPEQWGRVLKLLDDALRAAGWPALPRRYQAPVLPEWQDVLDRVAERYSRSHLRRLAVFASAQGVAPDAVDNALIVRFADALEDSMLERPRQTCRDSVQAWNRWAQESGEGRLVAMPFADRKTSLRLEAFPASFRLDAEAFLGDLAGDDLFAVSRRRSRPKTIQVQRERIRRLATLLVGTGRDPGSIRCLADLVEPDVVRAVFEPRWEACGREPSGDLDNLARLLLTIARHYVKAPEETIVLLKRLAAQVRPKNEGMIEKNRERLRVLTTPENTRLLVGMPQRLLAEAKSRPVSVSDAADVQAAAAVAILLAAAIRAKNLAELHLMKNLQRVGTGEDSAMHLVLPGHGTKNREPIEMVLPAPVVAIIDIYLARFRPLLADDKNPWLFPNRTGGHKRPSELASQVPREIKAVTGRTMNLHLFRHFAAFQFLKRHPGEYETVRCLLGHKDIRTTVEFYCGFEQGDAFRRYDAILDGLRGDGDAAP